MNIELLLKEKLNNFEVWILVQLITRNITINYTLYQDSYSIDSTNKDQNSPSYKKPTSPDIEEFNTRVLKKIKAFLRRIAKIQNLTQIDILKLGFTTIILRDSNINITVPISKSYYTVINNLVYRSK